MGSDRKWRKVGRGEDQDQLRLPLTCCQSVVQADARDCALLSEIEGRDVARQILRQRLEVDLADIRRIGIERLAPSPATTA